VVQQVIEQKKRCLLGWPLIGGLFFARIVALPTWFSACRERINADPDMQAEENNNPNPTSGWTYKLLQPNLHYYFVH
jgi:hypothetical protein